MKKILLLVFAPLFAACVQSNGRFGGVMPDGTATSRTVSAGEGCPPGGT